MSNQRRTSSKLLKDSDGKILCSCGCNRHPIKPRITWFSQECVDQWKIANDPGYMRETVYKRDRGICAKCGCDSSKEFKKIRQQVKDECWIDGKLDRIKCKAIFGRWSQHRSTGYDIDHIIPVVEGGGQCTIENLRTLCHPCHKDETAALAGRRAAAKRLAI